MRGKNDLKDYRLNSPFFRQFASDRLDEQIEIFHTDNIERITDIYKLFEFIMIALNHSQTVL